MPVRVLLTGVMGLDPPSWQVVVEGARPETQPLDEFEPGGVRQGWQHEAASRTEEHFREVIFDTISDRDREVLLCEWPPQAVSPQFNHICFVLSSFGASGCPLSLCVRSWRCGRAIDPGVLHQRVQLQGYADNRRSSQLTRPSCAQCFVMVIHNSEPPSVMESFSRRRAGGRSDSTQNWWDLAAELAWWCLRWRLGAGGQLRPGLSLLTWPKLGLVKRCRSCKDAQNKRGA